MATKVEEMIAIEVLGEIETPTFDLESARLTVTCVMSSC